MGIKDLWTILTPFCERKPLFELQDKKVAIDLSGWVCQAQCIAEYDVQPKMYLRNLYFRTSYLLLQGVHPVFVLEGEAPTLKYKTIAARNQLVQFKGAKPRKEGTSKGAANNKGRSRFNSVLKQCEEMLRLMGLACLTGSGEAEAMCAYLNEEGMVDGCISQDSDCFAYGAHVVYRNFSISQQGAHAASGGSIDVYDIRKATQATGFGRDKVVALALLCGSDYNSGVFGVGKDSALKLFARVDDKAILDHLRGWKLKTSLYGELERKLADKNVCSQCGHSGKKAGHARSGCADCGTTSGCDLGHFQELKNEMAMRSKALEDPAFPNEELISEFLHRKDKLDKLNLAWKRPDMKKFMQFTSKYLQWEELYAFEKFLPILTRWMLSHPDQHDGSIDPNPEYIKKARNPKGISNYEIIWNCEHFVKSIPDEQLSRAEPIKLFATIEPQESVRIAHPDLIERFERSKIKPRKNKRAAKKIKVNTIERYVVKGNESDDSSCFGDEDDEYDLDTVMDGIVGQGLPQIIKNKLAIFMENSSNTNCEINNTSSFFQSAPDEVDLFETTFNRIESSDEDSDSSFDEILVPLIERLKRK